MTQLDLFAATADTYTIRQDDGTDSTLSIEATSGRRVIVRSELPGHEDQWALFERDADGPYWRQITRELTKAELAQIAGGHIPMDLRKWSGMVSAPQGRWLEAAWQPTGEGSADD